DYVHEDKNELFHHRLEKKNLPIMADYFEKIIAQGVTEGLFDTKYPREAGIAIMAASSILGHGMDPRDTPREEVIRMVMVVTDIMERILGAKPGTFQEVLKMLEESK
ncbi:MAG: hypothetical protein JSV09_08245, partial [Thermoplasmata archaeon]